MRRFYLTYLAAVAVALALAFSGLAVHAQMYPQDIHSQHRPTGSSAPAQQWSGGMGPDSSSAFLQRREEEERERRESQERQRRMMENFTNIPDQLLESYPRRDTRFPFNSR
jgi:hypothetical protein